MKKTLLFVLLLAFAGVIRTNAQIVNNDFENWELDTFYLAPNQISTLPADTISFYDPVNWSSSNTLTGLDSLGGKILVTQSNNAYSGSSAMRLTTDTVNLPVIANLPFFKITIPGFALNGKFPITASSLISGGTTITPLSIKGAGQPFTQRLAKIKGYYNYTPVFNTNTQANDTCLVWATLRKGQTVVADAIFKSNASTGGYQAFEASFVYSSCEIPDTLVILTASSVPNVQQILGGTSGLQRGSVLLLDSVSYELLPGNYQFRPFARPDFDTTLVNTPKNVMVKANDDDCDNGTSNLTINVTSAPLSGTAVVGGNNSYVTYTPNNGYSGIDIFYYTLNDGSNLSDTVLVRMFVRNNSGINEANEVPVAVYPVPASNQVNIDFENKGHSFAYVYDMVGNLVLSAALNSNTNPVSVSGLANGIYSVQIVDEKNAVIARTRFSVSK